MTIIFFSPSWIYHVSLYILVRLSCFNESSMKFLVVFYFVLMFFYLFPQGPIDGFMKGKGNMDAAISFSDQRSKRFYGAANQEYSLNFQAQMLSFFAQYGLSKEVDAVFSLPFIFGQVENKFQDLGLFLKYRPVHYFLPKGGELDVLLSGGISFPFSDYRPDITGAVGQRAQQIPLRSIVQLKMPNGVFMNGTYTFNYRMDELNDLVVTQTLAENPSFIPENPAHSSVFMGRFGLATTKYFMEIFLERQITHGGVDFRPDVVLPPQLYGVNFTKIGGTFYYDAGTNGIAFTVSYVPAGRNIGNVFNLSLAFIIKYRSE